MKKTILTIGSLLLAGSLYAQWQTIDDLESYTLDAELDADPDPAVSTGPWNMYRSADEQYATLPLFNVIADPFGGGQGQVLCLDPGVPSADGQGNTTLERALPDEMKIKDPFPNTGKATFYFRYARPIVDGVPAQADTTWGLVSEAARDATSGTHAYGSYSVLGRTEIDGIIDIRDGGDYLDLVDTALETNTWYEIWFVVDHGNNTFTQYIKGGTDFPEQTQLRADGAINATYRFATLEDLETILLVTTTGNAASLKGQDPVYFDDFHVDVNAENLTSPGAPAPAWQTIDDMESYTLDAELDADPDPAVSTGPWNMYRSADEQYATLPLFNVIADPFGAGQGQVLCLDPGVPSADGQGNTTLERALPEGMRVQDPFPNTGTATFYFRYARPIVDGVPAQADTTWGLVSEAARDATSGTHAYGSYSVLGRTEIDGIIDIRDGGDYLDLVDTALQTNTWYEIWFVIDHGNNTFTQYIKGGTDFPEQTQLRADGAINATYRFATLADLETILLVTTTGNAASLKGQDPVYFDDFHIDVTGTNLTSPGAPVVGPPMTLATAAGSTTIEYDAPVPAGAIAGYLVFDDGGNELGKIASVSGNVITLEAALAAALPAGSVLTFVEDMGGGLGETAGKLINISTRGNAGTGDDVLIGGFVIGEATQDVMIFARAQEIPGLDPSVLLADPVLTITNPQTGEVVGMNDNWEDDQGTLINDVWGGFPPVVTGSTSSGIIMTLTAGPWTGTVSGKDGATGLVIFEVFEID